MLFAAPPPSADTGEAASRLPRIQDSPGPPRGQGQPSARLGSGWHALSPSAGQGAECGLKGVSASGAERRPRWGREEENPTGPYRSATFHTVGATVFAVVCAAVVWAASRVPSENLCR